MKTRFLDVPNCHALLPQGHGLSLVQKIEECLQGINDADGPLRRSIDRLIAHNQKTLNRRRGSERFLDSAVEVGPSASPFVLCPEISLCGELGYIRH